MSFQPSALADEAPSPAPESQRPPFLTRILDDYRHFYSGSNALYLGAGLGVNALLANTDADEETQRWVQDDLRSKGSDDVAKIVKDFGDWRLVSGIYLGVAVLGSEPLGGRHFAPLGTLGEWGERNVRALALGSPTMYFMQRIPGSGRPRDRKGSGWDFWDDSNGASGHGFVGAIPFLTAAEMTESLPLQVVFYAASGLTTWSRMNDDAHFLSQSLLGWFVAWRAVRSVDASEDGGTSPRIDLVPVRGAGGAFVISGRF